PLAADAACARNRGALLPLLRIRRRCAAGPGRKRARDPVAARGSLRSRSIGRRSELGQRRAALPLARRVPARWAARGARTVPLRPERQRAAIPPRDALLGGRRPHAAGPEPDGSVPPGREHSALSVREQAAGAVALL